MYTILVLRACCACLRSSCAIVTAQTFAPPSPIVRAFKRFFVPQGCARLSCAGALLVIGAPLPAPNVLANFFKACVTRVSSPIVLVCACLPSAPLRKLRLSCSLNLRKKEISNFFFSKVEKLSASEILLLYYLII